MGCGTNDLFGVAKEPKGEEEGTNGQSTSTTGEYQTRVVGSVIS